MPGAVSRGNAGVPETWDRARGAYWGFMHRCRGASGEEPASRDVLNARTFAMAEKMDLPIMTICSTCQGVMSQANKRLKDDPEYLALANSHLAEEGLEYKGTAVIKHLLWVIIEDVGLEALKGHITAPLTHLRVAPFYGCYILRPSDALGFDERPERQTSLESVIEALGGRVVDFPGKSRCCGFPILTINERNSVAMVAKHTSEASDLGADAMVTPCPLCHLNLDGLSAQGHGPDSAHHQPPHPAPAPAYRPGHRPGPKGPGPTAAYHLHRLRGPAGSRRVLRAQVRGNGGRHDLASSLPAVR